MRGENLVKGEMTKNRESVLAIQKAKGWNDAKAAQYYSENFEPIRKGTWRKWRWNHKKAKKPRARRYNPQGVRRICGTCKFHKTDSFPVRCGNCAEKHFRTGNNRPLWRKREGV